jgi:hypothetical protein
MEEALKKCEAEVSHIRELLNQQRQHQELPSSSSSAAERTRRFAEITERARELGVEFTRLNKAAASTTTSTTVGNNDGGSGSDAEFKRTFAQLISQFKQLLVSIQEQRRASMVTASSFTAPTPPAAAATTTAPEITAKATTSTFTTTSPPQSSSQSQVPSSTLPSSTTTSQPDLPSSPRHTGSNNNNNDDGLSGGGGGRGGAPLRGNLAQTQVAAQQQPTKKTRKFKLTGWLRKQGEFGLKTWKRRWFKFKDGKLMYFSDDTDLKPKGFIDLADMQTARISEGERFEVVCSKRVWHLQADRERDAQDWVKALNLWRTKQDMLAMSVPTPSGAEIGNEDRLGARARSTGGGSLSNSFEDSGNPHSDHSSHSSPSSLSFLGGDPFSSSSLSLSPSSLLQQQRGQRSDRESLVSVKEMERQDRERERLRQLALRELAHITKGPTTTTSTITGPTPTSTTTTAQDASSTASTTANSPTINMKNGTASSINRFTHNNHSDSHYPRRKTRFTLASWCKYSGSGYFNPPNCRYR